MTPWERKKALGHGIVTALHKETGRSIGYVADVINGKARSGEAAIEIAEAASRRLNKPMTKVFPEFAKAC